MRTADPSADGRRSAASRTAITHPFNGPFSGTTRVSRYQKGKTNLDFTEARDSEWQWHQLGRMQVCISLQTDNHTSTPLLSFVQAGCPSCRPTNSVKALKAELPSAGAYHLAAQGRHFVCLHKTSFETLLCLSITHVIQNRRAVCAARGEVVISQSRRRLSA